MIKLKYSQVNGPGVSKVIQKIENMPLDQKLAYDLHRIFTPWKKAQRKITGEYMDGVVKELAKLDDDGNPIADTQTNAGFAFKEGITEADVQKANQEFSDKEFVIDRDKIDPARFTGVRLAPIDFEVLGPILLEGQE